MNMMPEVLFKMEFGHFWLKWKGYNDKLWREHDLIRMQTSILYYSTPSMSKAPKPKFERFWPERGKKTQKISDAVKKRLKKIREEEALRLYNEKNGTAT